MGELTLDGRRFAWREAGASGPPVILAHCSLAHSGLWKGVMARLADRFRLLAIDLPAHGGSDPPPDGVSLQVHAVRLCRELILRLGEPAHLVGLSLGGAVLARLALRHPETARTLTLIEPVLFHLLRTHRPEAAAANDRLNAGLMAALARGDHEGAARAFMEEWGMPGRFDALDAAGRAYAVRCLVHIARDFPMAEGFPPGQIGADEIARLALPVLLVAGETSPLPARAAVEVLAGLLPGARHETLAGAGHLAPVTHPDAVAGLLGRFLGRDAT